MSIQIVIEKCTGCTLCVKACPFDAIRIMDKSGDSGLASTSQSHKSGDSGLASTSQSHKSGDSGLASLSQSHKKAVID